MTYLEAAIAVLKASATPKTAAEITEAAVRRRLIAPRGRTPDASMSAVLYVYVRDAKKPVIKRLAKPGPVRAARESVRWTYSD